MKTDIIQEVQDYTYLTWTKTKNSSGTAGSFLKAYSEMAGRKIYYKLSNYDAYRGIVGHECVNELIVDRLLTVLGIEHLHYQLIHADIQLDGEIQRTFLCASEDFRKPGESKIALDVFYQAERLPGEKPLDFCIRHGWEEYVYRMLVADYLILNRDRHGANMEVLRDKRKHSVRLAPIFDHGLSLVFQCMEQNALSATDVMEDKPVQCFVGTKSARDNLDLIPRDKYPILRLLRENDRESLFDGLETVLPQAWQDKIWEMIWKRWSCYEDLCCQR